MVTANIAGTVQAGGNLTVNADDSIAILADSEIDISAAATNNLSAFTTLAENIAQRGYDFTTKSGVQSVSFDSKIRTAGDFAGDPNIVYKFRGTAGSIDLGTLTQSDLDSDWVRSTGNADLTDIFPDVGNLAESNARATGGLIVLNDVRGEVEGSIKNTTVDAGGRCVGATRSRTRPSLPAADSNVSASGGSAWGTGEVVAINGQIVSNVVLSKANAFIKDSTIGATTPIGGNLSVNAENTSRMDATLNSGTSTGDTAVAFTFAFNTVGWKAQNVLFAAADAFVSGDPLVAGLFEGAEPAEVQAYIVNSDVDVAGDLSVTAAGEALLNATTSNASESAAGALIDATGESEGDIVTSNKVNSFAKAYIDNSKATNGQQIIAGGSVTVTAADEAGVFANVKLVSASSTSNDGGAAVLQEFINDVTPVDYRTDGATSQFRQLRFGDLVRLDNSFPGDRGNPSGVYKYLGDSTDGMGSGSGIDLAAEDYTNLDFWKEFVVSQIIPQGRNITGSDSIATSSVIVYNDVRSSVEAYIEDATVTAANGDVTVTADETATIMATNDAAVSSSGGSVFGEGKSDRRKQHHRDECRAQLGAGIHQGQHDQRHR